MFRIYITSSDGHVSTSLWVKHEYKSEAIPSATILKQQKEPVIQQHHEATTGVSCVELSPGRVIIYLLENEGSDEFFE